MHKIKLVCTRHNNLGLCNSNELYKLIASIKPEVIFEEIPPLYFNDYYVSRCRRNLETEAIHKYLESHSIPHIPVDYDDIPPKAFFQDYQSMFNRIEKLIDQCGFDLRNLIARNKEYIETYGFKYLNTVDCEKMYTAIEEAIQKCLQTLNDKRLIEINNSWHENHFKREYKMLQNIYQYTMNHRFEKAVFLIGAWHRKSITQKIQEFQQSESLMLNWSLL